MPKTLEVLIVDDSLIFRSAIEQSLRDVDDVQVIGSVRNGVKAIEFIRSQRPDLVTLDVEMPEMDGLETLREIQAINAEDDSKHPIGTIMVSAMTHKGADTTIEALEVGAFDFITKPQQGNAEDSMELLRRQLLTKIRYFSSQKLSSKLTAHAPAPKPAPEPPRKTAVPSHFKAILIGFLPG